MLSAEFDVVTADDGEDGWYQLQRDDTIQVVFSDLEMPSSNGYELLHRIRTASDQGLQSIPVIMVTGADEEGPRLKCLEMGATDFITKPFSSAVLIARARAHATHRRVSREREAQTTIDALTGLTNEVGFVGRLEQDISYARRHQQPITLMRVEIDDLAGVARKHGMSVAARLVMHLAILIRTRIRKEDTAAHIGLGAFAISLPGGHLEGIQGMIEWFHAQIAENPPNVNGERFPIVLRAVALSAELQHWTNAKDALNKSLALLRSASAGSNS